MDKPGGLTCKGFEYNVDLRRITRKMVGAVPEEDRRQAWSYTRHLLRRFRRLCKEHSEQRGNGGGASQTRTELRPPRTKPIKFAKEKKEVTLSISRFPGKR